MQQKTKRLFAILIVAAMILAILAPIFAYSVSAASGTQSKINNKQNSLSDAKKQKQQIQNQIQDVQGKKSDVLTQKKKIDGEISVLATSINKLDAEIAKKQTDIVSKENQINNLTVQINKNDALFKTRVRVMYEKGDTSYLEVVLNSKSFSDMFTRIELVREMATHDKQLINELNSSKKQVQTVKEELVTDKTALESDRAESSQQVAQQKKKAQESDQLMQQLNSQESTLKATEEKVAAEEESIRQEIVAMQKQQEEEARAAKQNSSAPNSGGSGGPAYSGGKLGWPCDSRNITSPYGNRMHPTRHVYSFHEGIDISAPMNSNVYACADGTVVTATYGSAYGYYVVINHGGGLATLYGHNSRLLVSVGQTVTRGQIIAKSGSTGNSTGPHIHLTVFLNGQYQNPINYLR